MNRIKKKFAYAAGLLLVAGSFTACEMLGGSCQTCQLVSYDQAGDPFAWGTMAEYCDDDLVTVKTTPPTTTNGVTTKYVCY